jgi:hypothetical protein
MVLNHLPDSAGRGCTWLGCVHSSLSGCSCIAIAIVPTVPASASAGLDT